MSTRDSKSVAEAKPANDADSLAALKSLLIGEEQQQLDELSERIADPELRSEDLAEVLPESLQLAGREGEQLAYALEKPVTTCIQRSIERDPEQFADALYPVMGPAIRQSISATLKGLVENINRSLEHSLSAQGLKWRIEAMRTGTPFAEVVLRHTLAFRVEQVFLIQPGSGLLMQHVHDSLAVDTDADAVSGMLTAIAQFVRDAFQAGEQDGLETVEIGEHTVLLVHGPQAYLACVVRGIAPSGLRRHCQEVMEKLHRKHLKALNDFAGDPDTLAVTRPLLESCLLSEHKQAEKRRGLAPATLVVLLLLLVGLGWGGYQWWTDRQSAQALLQTQQRFVEQLRAQPGIVLTETRFDQPQLMVRGLRDPLAASPQALLKNTALDPQQVELAFRPYQDIAPQFALARAQQVLAPPASVQLTITDAGVLRAEGVADAPWTERAAWLASSVAGINGWSDEGLLDRDQQLLREARRLLAPPDGVELDVQQGVLSLRGHAPLQWIGAVESRLAGLTGLRGHQAQLDSDEQLRFDALLRQFDGHQLHFIEGALFDDTGLQQIQMLAGGLHELLDLAGQLGHQLQALLVGRTDGVGLPAFNEQLATARALITRDYLVQQGLPDALFRVQTAVSHDGLINPQLRRVEVRLRTTPLD